MQKYPIYLLCSFDNTRALILFLGFHYLELLTIKPITNSVVHEFVSKWIVEWALYYLWFVLALVNSKNKFVIAKLMMRVWCIMNE